MSMTSDKPPLQTIFEGFKGRWKLRRSLESELPTFPRGTFTGTSTFQQLHPGNTLSYLYHETGELVTEQGHKLIANRKYIYLYSQEDEKISVWFVKEDDGQDVIDYLYHELEFEFKDDRWIAKGDHLCDMDMYWSFYDFRLDESQTALSRWGLKHKVKGPNKDYSSDTVYQR